MNANEEKWKRREWTISLLVLSVGLLTFLFGDDLFGNKKGSPPPANPALTNQRAIVPDDVAPPDSPRDQKLVTNWVTVLLPSTYNDVDIFVDGRPAIIEETTPSMVKLRVVAPAGPHLFSFKKGSVVRERSHAVSNDQTNFVLTPFSN